MEAVRLDDIYKRRVNRLQNFMLENNIHSIRDIARNAGIGVSVISNILNDKANFSEKTARAIEHAYGLPIFYLDMDSDEKVVVYNPVYTLESYDKKISPYSIENINISEDCFYLKITENGGFFPVGALMLFKPTESFKDVEIGKYCLIKDKKNKHHIAEYKMIKVRFSDDTVLMAQDVNLVAKCIRIDM